MLRAQGKDVNIVGRRTKDIKKISNLYFHNQKNSPYF